MRRVGGALRITSADANGAYALPGSASYWDRLVNNASSAGDGQLTVVYALTGATFFFNSLPVGGVIEGPFSSVTKSGGASFAYLLEYGSFDEVKEAP